MNEPQFQVFECTDPDCRLRFPSDLSVKLISNCPLCSSPMQPVGDPFSNFHRPWLEVVEKTPKLSLLLDNLRSTENVGSIFRSANGAGAFHIYCCGTTPTPRHTRVRKASLGAEIDTSWSYHRNSIDLARELSSSGCRLVALESTPLSSSLFTCSPQISLGQSIILMIGNEISGIDPELLRMADIQLHIPMSGAKTSLNAAVATGIAVYYISYQLNHTTEHV